MDVGQPLDRIGKGLFIDLRVLRADALADGAVCDGGKFQVHGLKPPGWCFRGRREHPCEIGQRGSAGLNRLGRRAQVMIAEVLAMKADQTEPEKGPV